jgi:hypothetical protein
MLEAVKKKAVFGSGQTTNFGRIWASDWNPDAGSRRRVGSE